MKIKLTAAEIAELFLQPESTRGDGGYQSLLVRLQSRVDQTTGELVLTDGDLVDVI